LSKNRNIALRLFAASTMLVPVAAAHGQSTAAEGKTGASSDNVLTEIVVTGARRRSEAAQDTPISITAIGAGELDRRQVTSLFNIQQIAPSLHMHKQLGGADTLAIYLRGFGVNTNDPATNPAVSVFVDGVYQAQVNGNALDLFDVQSIEVLKGPQGTVLGKNSPSGAIAVTTKRPVFDFEGAAQATYERFDRVELRGMVNVPLIDDVLAMRASLMYKKGGDYLKTYGPDAFTLDPVSGQQVFNPDAPHKRTMGGDNILTGRLGLLFTPTPDFDFYLSSFFARNRSPLSMGRPISTTSGLEITPQNYIDEMGSDLGAPLACSVFGYCTPLPKYALAPNYRKRHHVDTFDVTGTANLRFSGMQLSSVTGYKNYDGENNGDIDSLPVTILTVRDSRLKLEQFSQELRLASEKGGADLDGKLDWLVGLYYFRSVHDYTLPIDLFGGAGNGGVSIDQNQHGVTSSMAAFAQAEVHVTDKWSISFGGRQTWDKKTHNSYAQQYVALPVPSAPPRIFVRKKWQNFSLELGSSYKFDNDKLVYVRYAEGYRGGGMQPFPTTFAGSTPYDPETVKSYQIGAKTDWLDKRLRVNVDLFWNDYKNLQRTLGVKALGGASLLLTENIPGATTKGFEIETVAVPVDRLTLRGSIAYLKTKYKGYVADVLGTGVVTDNNYFRFAFAPKWVGTAGADLTLIDNSVGKVVASADYSYTGRQLVYGIEIPAADEKSYGVVDLSLRYTDPSDRYTISLYGKNVFNKYYRTSIETVSNLALTAVDSPPATYGVTVGAKF